VTDALQDKGWNPLPDRTLHKSKRALVTATCSLVIGTFAIIVLVGWHIHSLPLMCVLPGFITMKANSAIGFLACSIALPLTLGKRRSLAAWPAACAGLLGAATLFEYIRGDLGIDEFVFKDPYSAHFAGRMAPITAANFIIVSLAVLFILRGRRGASQVFFAVLGFSSLFAVLGYAYGVPLLYGSNRYTAMALHTGASFLLLALGGLAASSDGGLLALVWIEGPSTYLVRRLLPASVLIPALTGLVILRNPISRIDPRLAAALIVILNIVLFALMVIHSSLTVYRLQIEKQKAESLSHVDPLTQSLNRRGLDLAIDQEFMRWRRFKTPFSLVMIDIDHFKSINDQHGHLMGDAVLQKLTASWRKQVRSVDVLARYGGEEFVLISLGTNSNGGFSIAEKLREESLRTSTIEFGFTVSVSCGIATVGEHGANGKDLLQSADSALYKAKSEGRNRTIRADSLRMVETTASVI
jgi:diguanylate cyclase (GGDEF)-like protein